MTLVQESDFAPTYEILTPESNTLDWLGLRKTGVGASESAAVLGDSAWGTPYTIWQQKVSPEVVDATTDLMEFGHLAEPLMVAFMEAHPERFRFIGEIVPSEGLLRSIEWPWLLGTLDRRILTPEGIYVPLELKSVNDFVASEWKAGGDDDEADERFGSEGSGRYVVPKKYVVQVQQQMAVTGAPFAYVAVWLGKSRLEIIRVERDQAYIDEFLVGRVGDFWRYFVETNTAPPASLNDDLWERWPGNRGEVIDADEDVLDLVGRFRIAKEDEAVTKAELKELKFEIAQFMGDATELRSPGSGDVVLTVRGQNTRRTVDMTRLEREHPEAYEACVNPPGWSRIFRTPKGSNL